MPRKKSPAAPYVPSDRSKAIAWSIADAIGSRPPIRVFEADHFPEMRVAVLSAHGWPEPDMDTVVTLDLGDDPFPIPGARFEFYVVASPGWDIEQVLGDVGVRVRREIVAPEPGEFIEHGMMPTYENLHVQHLAVLDPPLVALPVTPPGIDPPVGFLQLVPFTDAELEVLEKRGRPGFYSLLRDQGRRLLDFARE